MTEQELNAIDRLEPRPPDPDEYLLSLIKLREKIVESILMIDPIPHGLDDDPYSDQNIRRSIIRATEPVDRLIADWYLMHPSKFIVHMKHGYAHRYHPVSK